MSFTPKAQPTVTGPSWVRWQQPMTRVLLALVPVILEGIYLFGWRVVTLLVATNAAAFVTEYAFTRQWKEPVTSAAFVTATLFTLSLPPTLPVWMAVVGIVFGIAFGKMVFGGFGRNVFNPALTGRAFIYVCFGNFMTAVWAKPFTGGTAGFGAYAAGVDAITQATPGMLLKTGTTFDLWTLAHGATAGTIGGTGVVFATLGGLYLIWKKTANYRIPLAGILSYLILQGALWKFGVKGAAEPLHAMLAGGFILGMFFYATDPVSASQTDPGRWIYGALVGALSSLIGVFSAWPAGTMFAILLGNMFAPLIDLGVKSLKDKAAGGAAKAKG